MLTVLRDAQDHLEAVCEWWPVDINGRWEPKGSYIYVHRLEHSPGVQGVRMIRQIIADIAWRCPWAVGAYWERERKTGDKLHAFRRTQLLRGEVKV